MFKKYGGKENYVHDCTLEWRKGHINFVIINEKEQYIKGRVLDVGCNSGDTTYYVLQKCDEVYGIDVNKKAIDRAIELYKGWGLESRAKFFNCTADRLPFEDGFFDNATMFSVLEHIFPEDVKTVLTEISRVLKDGAYLLITTPRSDYTSQEFYGKFGAFDPAHKQNFFGNMDVVNVFIGLPFNIVLLEHEKRANPKTPGVHDAFTIVLRNNKNKGGA